MSDAYCHADHCIRDFLSAMSRCKYIIPVFAPDQGVDVEVNGKQVSTGWTGPADEDWWQHIKRVSPCLHPETGRKFSWAVLSQFKPVDLRSSAEVEGLEVVRRVYSRLHRGEYVKYEAEVRYAHWMKRGALCSFDNDVASAEGRKEAELFFNRVDANGDGLISQEELERAFPQLAEVDAADLMHEADEDGDGLINFDEWLETMQTISSESRTLQSRPLRRAAARNAASSKKFPVAVCLQQLREEFPQLGMKSMCES